MAKIFHLFSQHIRFVVGNGERIRFLEDLWLGDQPLCVQFLDLYSHVYEKFDHLNGSWHFTSFHLEPKFPTQSF